jgi:hypothetical protein
MNIILVGMDKTVQNSATDQAKILGAQLSAAQEGQVFDNSIRPVRRWFPPASPRYLYQLDKE